MSRLRDLLSVWWGRLRSGTGGMKQKASAYAGAAASRLLSDWGMAVNTAADDQIRWDLRTLRDRSRELVRNNPHARRFVSLMVTNVVGARGIRLQSQIETTPGEPDITSARVIEDGWAEWGQPENCSADGRLSWLDIEDAVVRSLCGADGEALLLLVPGAENPFGFAVQLLDPDLLDETHNEPPDKAGVEIRMGVEMDRWGRPLAYHIWDKHPRGRTAGDAVRNRIPAARVCHLYLLDRAGQSRGIPRFAPILTKLKIQDGYEEAELVNSRASAAKMGFITPDPESILDPNSVAGSSTSIELEADPGRITTLPPGWQFNAWDPQHPTTAYEAFTKAVLRSIAAGLDVSYASLSGDLRDVNYSSIRAGLLQERDIYRALQGWVSRHLHRRVYREWLKWAVTVGALEGLTVRDLARAQRVSWMGRGWAWVDPLKDVQASVLAIRSGLSTLTRELAAQGLDLEDVLRERQREQRLQEAYGVTLDTSLPTDQPQDDEDQDVPPFALIAGA